MLVFRYKMTAVLFTILMVIALAQIVFFHTAQYIHTAYGLSQTDAWLLVASLSVAYVLTSFFSLRAYARVRYYADSIAGSTEWGAFRNLYQGLLLFSVIAALILILSFLMLMAQDRHLTSAPRYIQLADYTQTYFGFTISVLLYTCSVKLLSVNRRFVDRPHMIVNLLFIAFSAMYTFLVFHHPAQTNPQALSLLTIIFPNSYAEPEWLALTTLIIPRLILWYVLCIAILNLFQFQQKTKGALYRRAFQTVPIGWLIIILSLILYRVAQAALLTQANLHPGPIVLCCTIIGFAAMILTGAILVAYGVDKLQAIENM